MTETVCCLAGFTLGASALLTSHFNPFPSGYNHLAILGVSAIAGGLAITSGAARKKAPATAFVTSCLLGGSFAGGIIATQLFPQYWQLAAYVSCMSAFHCGEYLVTSIYNHESLSFDSFLLNHGWPYAIAQLLTVTEYSLRMWYFPAYHANTAALGLFILLAGDAVRKAAMITAGSNFKHIVASVKQAEHKLVTTGIYSFSRHPSYAGWFWWAAGMQVMMNNPVSLIAACAASVKFFQDRLEVEEYHLYMFFGAKYKDFSRAVGTGIPFVKGFQLTEEFEEYLDQHAHS